MSTLVRWAVMLYPSAWRARYGGELEALMEDTGVRGGDVWDLARGALFMQMTSLNFGKIVAAFTLAGVVAAGVWAVAQPRQYVSTAVMQLSSPGGGGTPDKIAQMQRLQHLQQDVLSRKSLASIISAQNLFQTERQQLPLEDIIQQMRNRNLRIQAVNVPGKTVFEVKYSAAEPAEAQAAARAIVTAMVERNLAQAPAAGQGPANLEVLDPASLPSEPSAGNRTAVMGRFVGLGLALGLVCGTVMWVLQRSKVSGWRIAGFAAAGMAVGLGIAFLIPNQYISTAVLRPGDAAAMQSAVTRVLSEEAVSAMIRRQGLFAKDVNSEGIESVARKVRNERIRVQAVEANGLTAYVVSFRYPDRFTAQRVTRDLVTQFTGQPNTEVLDPPSDPMRPSSPNRLQIAGLGTALGILLGLTAARMRRNTPVPA